MEEVQRTRGEVQGAQHQQRRDHEDFRAGRRLPQAADHAQLRRQRRAQEHAQRFVPQPHRAATLLGRGRKKEVRTRVEDHLQGRRPDRGGRAPNGGRPGHGRAELRDGDG